MSKKLQWIMIEGLWSGYTASQRHVVHRELTNDVQRAEWCQKHHAIYYTDGTALELRVEFYPRKPRKFRENRSYTELISNCIRCNTDRVADLPRKP